MKEIEFKKLKGKALLLTFSIIFIVASFRVYSDVQIYEKNLENKQKALVKQIDFIFKDEKEKITKSFIARGTNLVKNEEVIKFFKNKDREGLYKLARNRFNTFKETFPTFSVMHFFSKDYTSFLRVHKKEVFGDVLKDRRPIVKYSIENKQIVAGFEHGLHDNGKLSYRVVLPIFDKEEFLGVLELGIDFIYVNDKIEEYLKSMYETNFYIMELIDSTQKAFINDKYFSHSFKSYKYIESSEYLNSLIKHIETKNEQHIHFEDKVYFASWNETYLEDFNGNKIGTLFYIFDVTKEDKEVMDAIYSSILKPFILLLLIMFVINLIFNYFYKEILKVSLKTRKILDTQSSIIVLTDGLKMVDCNQSLLDFFGFKSFEAFSKNYDCICDRFISGEGLLEKKIGDENWATYVVKNSTKVHKAKIADVQGKEHLFTVQAKEYKYDMEDIIHEVITFIDITDLETLNKQLVHQQKQASLGEMIGNIAHQWRQPLSAILSTVSSIQIQKQLGLVDDKDLDKSLEMIATKAHYLSDTINDFRDFIKGEKVKSQFDVDDVVEHALSIVDATLKNNYINVIREQSENIFISGHKNELLQVIINIINNAKDVLSTIEEEDRYIFIELVKVENNAVIYIKDTAGGIPKDVIARIFEPYFTTKHQSQGTGLGLYMSHQMIVDSMSGNLKAYNETFIYNEKEYTGAVFKIVLPLS